MLGKTSTFKRFRYSPLAQELKAQSHVEKKNYQKVDKGYEIDETINEDDKKSALTNNNKSDPIYDGNQSFYKYCQCNKKYGNLSFESKYCFLAN